MNVYRVAVDHYEPSRMEHYNILYLSNSLVMEQIPHDRRGVALGFLPASAYNALPRSQSSLGSGEWCNVAMDKHKTSMCTSFE